MKLCRDAEYYSARVACIPVVGWGVAIGIGVADLVWGEKLYNWVETKMEK